MTRSAAAGYSAASRRPISTRVACSPRPPMVVSGRARYTYSNRHTLGAAAANRRDRRPRSSSEMNSPGSTSRTKDAPTMSSAAVSLATTHPLASFPTTSGRNPWGSRAAYRAFSSM